jgi:Flp pilus assembly protein TadG
MTTHSTDEFVGLAPFAMPLQSTRRRGTSAVEFAIVASAFLTIVLGIIEIGRGLMVKEQLNSAAIQGARAGSLKGNTSADVQAAVTTALQGMQPVDAAGASLGTFQIYDNGSLVYDSSIAGTYASPVTVASGHSLRVAVSVSVNQISWVPAERFLGKGGLNLLTGNATLIAE